jgi:hypothetical protein
MFMPTSTPDNKKSMGRPRTGIGQMIGVRLQPDELELLDLWIAANDDGISRPEGLRRILKLVALRMPA